MHYAAEVFNGAHHEGGGSAESIILHDLCLAVFV